MNYRLIEAKKPNRPVSRLCSTLGVSRSGYYAWASRPVCERELTDAMLTDKIEKIHKGSGELYGAPKMHADLADEHDIRMGRKRVARLMKEAKIKGVMRGGRWRATVPDPAAAPAPDLVERAFTATAPDQLWVADLAYIPTASGFLLPGGDHRHVLAHGRGLVDEKRHEGRSRGRRAVHGCGQTPAGQRARAPLRGSQYTSLAFATRLEAFDITASMGSRGDAYDNAVAESFMAIIKTELTKRCRFANHMEARTAVFDYIEGFYHRRRRHSALGYKSPLDF